MTERQVAIGGIIISSHKIKIALIEDSLDICKALRKYLDEQICFEVVGMAHNGADGLDLLLNTPCDVALIDIIMPQKDGISVLEGLKNYPVIKKPACIMFTAVSHDGLTKKALELGADYFILKPFDMDVLARRILDIHDHRAAREALRLKGEANAAKPIVMQPKELPENYISDILRRLGIPSNLNGYTYLKKAAVLAVEDPTRLTGITKVLYPEIAKKCETTPVRVERSIRHAIQTSWVNGNAKAYKDFLNYSSSKNEKPTNSHFISLVVEKYLMYLHSQG